MEVQEFNTNTLLRCCDCKFYYGGSQDEFGGEDSSCNHSVCFENIRYDCEYGGMIQKRVFNIQKLNSIGECSYYKRKWWKFWRPNKRSKKNYRQLYYELRKMSINP